MSDDTREEPTKAQLWNRIRQLEQAVYPNRREILKAGAAAAAGGAAVAASGSASAGSASTGQVGTQSDPVDAYVEDFYDHNGNQPLSLPGDGTVNATSVDADDLQHTASSYQGYSSVEGSRTASTWYQNTSNYPLHVCVTVAGGAPSGDTDIRVIGHVNDSQSDNRIHDNRIQSDNGTTMRASVSFVVPPGFYYKTDIDRASVQQWDELKIGAQT